MRVAVVSRLYRPETAAAAFFLGAVVDALTESGDDVEVITARAPGGAVAPGRERVRGWPVLRDRSGYVKGYVQYTSFDVPLLFRLLLLRRPDVLFVEPPPTTGAVVRIVCALRRIPYVYDAADIWSDAASMATGSSIVVRALRTVERFALRGARAIVTISQQVADRIGALGVTVPSTVTGFGADTSAFAYRAAAVLPEFVYAGSYSTWHGAEIAVEAFAKVSARYPDYRLRVIGNGERNLLESEARRLGVADRVTFEDQIPAAALSDVLSQATASIATLRPGTGYEYAFTSKAYSSLAAGCPVLFAGPGPTGSFIAAAADHQPLGTSVSYDADALAAAMAAAAANPLQPDGRAELATWARREHSLAAVGHRVAAVIHRAAGSDR